MHNLILCGLPGVGKTTVAQALSETLTKDWYDTDQLLEQSVGMSCRDYYLKVGAHSFRIKEREILESLRSRRSSIISIGGGSVELQENRILLPRLGTVLHLKCDLDILYSRIFSQGAPAYLNKESLDSLAHRRLPLFEQIQHKKMDVSRLPISNILEFLIKRYYGQ